MLVDLIAGGAAGAAARRQGLPAERVERGARELLPAENLGALRELALREVAEDVERAARHRRRSSRSVEQAVAERVLALVEPQPKSQRILRRAWRSAQRLGGEIDALWVRRPGQELDGEERRSSRRCAGSRSCSASHFLEEEGEDLVEAVRRVAAERGSTYVFVGTPDERRRAEILARLARLAAWSASCRASTSASSPTGRCATEARRVRLAGRRPRRPPDGQPRLLVPFTGRRPRSGRAPGGDPHRAGRGRRCSCPPT